MDSITVVGTGAVGSTLAAGWADAYSVTLGSRAPDDSEVRALGESIGATVADQRTAASQAEVVVLAVPGSVVETLAEDLSDALAGAVVLDPTNVLPRPESRTSLAEAVAEAAPDARVAKAFNTVGTDVMADPEIDGRAVTMPLAGDPDAVEAAETLAAELGFEPLRAGELDAAIYLEDMARLWIHLSRTYGREIAFELLRG